MDIPEIVTEPSQTSAEGSTLDQSLRKCKQMASYACSAESSD